MNKEILLLIDADQPCATQAHVRAHWSKLDVEEGQISIPALVEQHAMEVRRDYLVWVHDLGNYSIQGKTIKSHLRLFPNLSYWWMTLIAEKEPLKTDAIYTVFKLRALENLYVEKGCRGLVYYGSDFRLHLTLRGWCQKLGHTYEWHKPTVTPESRPSISLKQQLGKWLPLPVHALLFLARRWLSCYRISQPRQRVDKFKPRFQKQATIITYFPNVDLEKMRKGRFWSRYWEGLHELLDELPATINWIWIYVEPGECGFAEALALRDRCNEIQPDKYRHWLIEEFVTPNVLLNVVRNYVRLCWRAWRIASAKKAFCFSGSMLNFYPIMRADWQDSYFGITAIENLLNAAIFDELTQRLGPQAWGLYVWENQPWEQALVAAWRRNQTSRIIGSQHSVLRWFGLRSYSHPRDYLEKSQDARPLPDILAVNGSAARTLMLEDGFPQDRVAVVEALRYLNLSRTEEKDPRLGDTKTLLIVTGYQPDEVEYQLRLVNTVAKMKAFESLSRVWIKPHPFYPVESIVKEAALSFRHEIVNAPLSTLLGQTDVAFVSNSTAAILEAIYMRVPVAVCTAENNLNLSPVFGFISVPMISDPGQLNAFLSARPRVNDWPEDYFILDKSLCRWRNLLRV